MRRSFLADVQLENVSNPWSFIGGVVVKVGNAAYVPLEPHHGFVDDVGSLRADV